MSIENAEVIENTPAKALTLDQAFAQLKASRGQTDDTDQHLEDEDGVDVDEEVDDDFETEDTDLDDEDSEDDGSEDDDEEGDESEESEEDPDVWEIDIDGEQVEVSTDELHKGYLRQQDYTRKRQADATKAKALEKEYETKLSQLNTALEQNVSSEQRQLAALNQQMSAAPDDNTKRGIHYKMLQLQQTIATRTQALGQAEALRTQGSAAKQEAYWNEQEAMLRVTYEDWDTKKVELKDYLQAEGFTDLTMFAHATMAKLVDKAKQFDELQLKRKTVASKKIRRKVPTVLKAGQGEKKFSVDRNLVKKAESRFAKTGSIKDAMALQKLKRGK
jgi:hypothetical protein